MDHRIGDALLDALPKPPIQKQSGHVEDGVLPPPPFGLLTNGLVRLLCGHAPAPVSEHETLQLLFPDFELKTVELVLPRAGYSTEQEREAEILASLILERVAAGSPLRTSPKKTSGDEVLHRLEASLRTDRGES